MSDYKQFGDNSNKINLAAWDKYLHANVQNRIGN